jgi:hypothetical protein
MVDLEKRAGQLVPKQTLNISCARSKKTLQPDEETHIWINPRKSIEIQEKKQ